MATNIYLIILIILVTIIFWLVFLTIYIYKISRSFNRLIKEEVFNSITGKIDAAGNRFSKIEEHLRTLEIKDRSNIKRIGLVRFNPFEDTGGDQSFSLSLLDEGNNGLIISVLHGRGGTRIYCKPVKSGNESGYEFSGEEKEAINKAQKV